MADTARELGARLAKLFESAGFWWGVGISVALAVGTLALATAVIVTWPAARFRHDVPPAVSNRHPVLRVLGVVGKNVAGCVLILLGAVMALPGIPGQGVLTMIIGLTLLDFPGKREMEARMLRRPAILHAINRLRAAFKRPPLELD